MTTLAEIEKLKQDIIEKLKKLPPPGEREKKAKRGTPRKISKIEQEFKQQIITALKGIMEDSKTDDGKSIDDLKRDLIDALLEYGKRRVT